MDQSTWPEHLRDDALYQVCDRCGRKTWSRDGFGGKCTMPQWNGAAWGQQCGGQFRSPR